MTSVNKIYLLTCKVNGKIYIGQTWYTYDVRMGKDGCNYRNSRYLYSAICKYGVESFEYETLAECSSQEEADILEAKFIAQYNSLDPKVGYNLRSGGSAGRHAEISKVKIAKGLRGRVVSKETKLKISKAHIGKPKPCHTDDWKRENSIFMKKRHVLQGHPFEGKHHTVTAKMAMSEKLSGKAQSIETIEKRRRSRMEPPEVQQAVIEAYNSGKTIDQIKNAFGFGGYGKIYRILQFNNISLKSRK